MQNCRDTGAAVAGWLLIVGLIAAPLALGARPPLLRDLLAVLLMAAVVAVLPAVRWRYTSRSHRFAIASVAVLLAWGWLATLNGALAGRVAEDGVVATLPALLAAPSTASPLASALTLVVLTPVLLTVPAAAWLAREPRWRDRLLRAFAWTGAAVLCWGIAQQFLPTALAATWIARQPWAHGRPFGPFDYHNNAASFLLLTTPMIARAASAARGRSGAIGWTAAFLLVPVALATNVSRAGLVLGAVVWLISAALLWRRTTVAHLQSLRSVMNWREAAAIVAVLLVGVACVVVALTTSPAVSRMVEVPAAMSSPHYPRAMQYRAAAELFVDRPWTGYGPGAWKMVVQQSSIANHFFAPDHQPGQPFTVLSHVLQDYLQTLVEWGVLGSLVWVSLFAGGAWGLWVQHRRGIGDARPWTALALGGVLLHAMIDCPLQVPSIELYVAVLLGLAYARPALSHDASQEKMPACASC